MDPNPDNLNWLASLPQGSHACFFYTSSEEFFSIASTYFKESLSSQKERCLWVLPPKFSFLKAKQELQKYFSFDLEPVLNLRRFLILPWEKWYGQGLAIQELLLRGQKILKESLKEGFTSLRVLSHAPAKSSPYWKDFLVFEETMSRSTKQKPFTFLCAYSLVDCPAAAISTIASSHALCLIHHGSEWEWVPNQPLPTQSLHYNKHY